MADDKQIPTKEEQDEQRRADWEEACKQAAEEEQKK